MAPFSTFFTSLAFAIGAPRQNRIKHNECMLDTTLCTRYQDRVSHYRIRKRHSPCFIPPLAAQSESDVLDNSLPSHDDTTTTSDCSLSHLANLLGATPTNLLTLESNDEGVRVFMSINLYLRTTFCSVFLSTRVYVTTVHRNGFSRLIPKTTVQPCTPVPGRHDWLQVLSINNSFHQMKE
jgi:hypothetical protein